MMRKKKVVLLSHCFLNVNAKVHGVATVEAGCARLVTALLTAGFGIIQLPCAELNHGGLNRWGQTKEQYDFPAFRNRCRQLLEPIVEQVRDYARNGYEVAAVIGVDGSPTCGVKYACSGSWGGEIGPGFNIDSALEALSMSEQPGVMMEVLRDMLASAGLDITFLAADEADPDTEELVDRLRSEG